MQQQGSTLLKVVSIILIVFGALGIVAGISGLVGGGVVAGSGIADQATGTTLSINNGELSGSDADVAALGITALVLVGVIALISGALDLIIGIVGLKASNLEGKRQAHRRIRGRHHRRRLCGHLPYRYDLRWRRYDHVACFGRGRAYPAGSLSRRREPDSQGRDNVAIGS